MTTDELNDATRPVRERFTRFMQEHGDGGAWKAAYRSDDDAKCQPGWHGAFGDWLEEQGEEELAAFHQWYARSGDRLRPRKVAGWWSVLVSGLLPGMVEAVPPEWDLKVRKGRLVGFTRPDTVVGCLHGLFYATRAAGAV